MNADRVQLLEKYINEEPDEPFNKYALAMEYYETQPEIACKILSQLKSEKPSYLPLYFKLAHLLWEIEEYQTADTVFLEGIKLAEDKKDEKALKELKAAHLNFEFDRP